VRQPLWGRVDAGLPVHEDVPKGQGIGKVIGMLSAPLVRRVQLTPRTAQVVLIWLLDIFHTVLVGVSIWSYLVASFGDINVHDRIFWCVAITFATLRN
jgi:cytochrome c-type biogenesis protein CcmH/NrfF